VKIRKRFDRINFLINLSLLCIVPSAALAYDEKDIANVLGWIPDPYANLCMGYFSEPPSLKEYPHPGPVAQAPTQISYAGPGVIRRYGESTISQEVVITQPGRIAQADKAIIYRDRETGRIVYIRLEGHVRVQEHGKLITGPYTTLRLDQHTLETGPAAYHLYEDPKNIKIPTILYAYDAWGTMDRGFRDPAGIVHLTNATYTTCSPINPAWQISANRIDLDQKQGFGTAYNSTLKFYDFPVVYVPIYSFPIDNRRKTGFLTPDVSYEDKNGFQFALPYYWNLAPNYDLTTTPKYIEKRNFQLNSMFRYLEGPGTAGQVYLSLVPDDTAFGQFRNDTLDNPPTPPPGVDITPYLNDLSSENNFRGFFHLKDRSQLDNNWTGHLDLNYVTDDYFFQDFGTAYSDVVANQLLNQADVEYKDNQWSFVGLLQGYQTLHIIGQDATPALDQYSRLPELDANGDFPNLFEGVNFTLGAQSVNFAYQSDFEPTTFEMPIGERFHLRPTLSRPIYGSAGYINPQVSLDSTNYAAQLAAPDDSDVRPQFDASRNLPIADVDSGLYFDRHIEWDQNAYLATLEPRLFYLYVPFVNQDKYPNFDSELLPFTFPQLFDVNRFTSFDRLENANQMSFGLTSRVLNSNTSEQKFKIDLGFGYYFQSPRVCLDPTDCQTSTFDYISPDSHITPLVGQLTYYPWPDWSATGSYAYDASVGATNNGQVSINYNHNKLEVFTFNYQYVREQNGDPTDNFGLSNSTNLIGSGVAWPLTRHWSGLVYGQYNISKERADSYYGGLQYDTCCWTMRVIASRSFKEQDTNDEGQPIDVFKDSYYVQLQLKSLGSIGNSPSTLLSNTLSGLNDTFR